MRIARHGDVPQQDSKMDMGWGDALELRVLRPGIAHVPRYLSMHPDLQPRAATAGQNNSRRTELTGNDR